MTTQKLRHGARMTSTIAMTRQEWRDRYTTMTTLHSQLAPEQIASVMLDWYGACPDDPQCIMTWKSGAFDRSVTFRDGVFVTDIYHGHHKYESVIALVRNVPIPDDVTLQALLDLKGFGEKWERIAWDAFVFSLNDVAPNWQGPASDISQRPYERAVAAIRALAAERDRWSRVADDLAGDVMEWQNRAEKAEARCAELARGLADCSARLYATEHQTQDMPIIGVCVVIPGNAFVETWTHRDYTQERRETFARKYIDANGGTAHVLYAGAPLAASPKGGA